MTETSKITTNAGAARPGTEPFGVDRFQPGKAAA